MVALRRISVLLAALVLACVPAAAQAKAPKPDLSKVPKLKAVPPDLLAAFPVLGQKRATNVPNYVLRSWTSPRIVRTYGVDPRQTRAIGGMKGSPWWVTPGTKGMCVMISAGGVCAAKADVLARGLWFYRVPPPPKGEMPGTGSPEQVTTIVGLAPLGFRSILVTLKTGATSTIPVTATGAYRGDVTGPFTLVQMLRDGADPVTLSDLRPPS